MLEPSLEAEVRLGVVEAQRRAPTVGVSLSPDLPVPPGPLVLMVAVLATLTLSLLMVCGVLILGMELPAGMAGSSHLFPIHQIVTGFCRGTDFKALPSGADAGGAAS